MTTKKTIRNFLRRKFPTQDNIINKGKSGGIPGGIFIQLKKAGLFKNGGEMLKKIPEGSKGEGLRKLKAERPDVTRKMGFAKKGKMVQKALLGKFMKKKGIATPGMEIAKKTGPMGLMQKLLKKVKFDNGGEMKKRVTMIKQLRDKQVGPAEELRLFKMPIQDLREKVREKKMTKARSGKMIKANVGMAAKKVREKEVMKASMGKSVRGYGAAKTSGMGLQDEQLVPGKSLDYYKDLM